MRGQIQIMMLLNRFVNHILGNVDRNLNGYSQGNRITGPGINLNDLALVLDPDLREVRMVAKFVDVHILDFAAKKLNGAGQQVVGQRPRGRLATHAAINARRLKKTDHNRKGPLSIRLLEEDQLLFVRIADNDPGQVHLYCHGDPTPRGNAQAQIAPDHQLSRVSSILGQAPSAVNEPCRRLPL